MATERRLFELRRDLHLERGLLELAEGEERRLRLAAEVAIAASETYQAARNAEDRRRVLDEALESSELAETFRVARAETRELRRAVDWLQTEIEIHRDRARERRLNLFERALDMGLEPKP